MKFGHVKHCLGTRKRLLLWQTQSLPELHGLALQKPQPLSVLQGEKQQQGLVSSGPQKLKQCRPALSPLEETTDCSVPYLYKQPISMLRAKKVKQGGLLRSIGLQHNWDAGEEKEQCPHTPPLSTHWAAQLHFRGQKEDKCFIDGFQLPAHSVTIPKLGILDNPNSTWPPMLPPQMSSTWQFQTPHCSRDLQHHVTRTTQEV